VKKAFRDSYNRELALLYERSAEFAREYPGIADRLGGLVKDNLDPAVAGLLEGSAFLAARVQLKMDEEFRTFSAELLNQIFPDSLAPTPSCVLVAANPPFANKDLVEGLHFEPGSYLDARFVDADQRVSCRFRLCEPLSIWPLAIAGATYHGSPAPIMALGEKDVAPGTRAGLVLRLMRPLDATLAADGGPMSDVMVDDLPIYLTADLPDAVALYEQIFCDLKRVSLRTLDKHGDPVFMRLNPSQVQQIGLDGDHPLFPRDRREFAGFARLREVFAFPRRFLGFRLTGLRPFLARFSKADVQVILEFGSSNASLAARLSPKHFSLNTAAAVNLFEETASQIRLDHKRHEFVVTPDSSPITHYEINAITSVHAHYATVQARVPVFPLYGLPPQGVKPGEALYYTSRRKLRRLTEKERRFGSNKRYRGTETFITIYEPEAENSARAQRLQIRALCSNRHLPEDLPLASGADDFFMCEDVTVTLACVAGPSRPRESLAELERIGPHRMTAGDNYWRLISYLSMSHFALDVGDSKQVAEALRELLSLFVDPLDTTTEAQLRGILNVATRPIIRSIRRGDGYHAARGIEVKLTMDDAAFEGSGIILLGAVLDRFFAEYASVNSFTQTVIMSADRGQIVAFPPRTGTGPLL
jgi:type VI secretion system protein ImpG